MMDPTYLPPRFDVPAVAKAAEHFRKIHREHSKAATLLRELEERRHQAVEDDRALYATAIRKGKADPGQQAVEKLDAEMLATRRRTEALAVAVRDAEADLRAAIAKAKGEWAALLKRQAAEARDHYDFAVAAVEGATERLREVNGIQAWLDRFPAERLFYKPGGPTRLPSLQSRSGEGYLFDTVLEALRTVNAPPPPPQVVPLRPLEGSPAA